MYNNGKKPKIKPEIKQKKRKKKRNVVFRCSVFFVTADIVLDSPEENQRF